MKPYRNLILIVEDEPYLGRALQRILKAQHGDTCSIIVANSYTDGRQIIVDQQDELLAVVSDENLKPGEGHKLYQEMRSVILNNSIAWIGMSAAWGMNPNAVDYYDSLMPEIPRLNKPFDDIHNLRSIIGHEIFRHHGNTRVHIVIGDVPKDQQNDLALRLRKFRHELDGGYVHTAFFSAPKETLGTWELERALFAFTTEDITEPPFLAFNTALDELFDDDLRLRIWVTPRVAEDFARKMKG
ncbi:MAG: hypothetical protein Q8P90_06340 [bacterium]|nr:hypothetical protein [bacterium]